MVICGDSEHLQNAKFYIFSLEPFLNIFWMGLLEWVFWNGSSGMGLFEWVFLNGSFWMGLFEWVFLNGSSGMGLLEWVFWNGSSGMGLLEWVFLNGSFWMSLFEWVFLNGSFWMGLWHWVYNLIVLHKKFIRRQRFRAHTCLYERDSKSLPSQWNTLSCTVSIWWV